MTRRATQVLRPPGPEGRARRWVPFWVLQATEIAVAVVFIDISIHVSNGGLLVAGALACLALAVTADGPLGLTRICSRPLHLTLAVVIAVLVAVAPVVPALRPDIEGIIVTEFGAIGLLRVCTLTRVGPALAGARSTRWPRPRRTVIDATARVVDVGARPASGPSSSGPSSSGPSSSGPSSSGPSSSGPSSSGPSSSGPSSSGPSSSGPPSAGAAARWAGRSTAAAASAGKQAAAKYGPTARARIKKSVRTAGRIAGTATSPPPDHRGPAG
jgi:hypothetical protein